MHQNTQQVFLYCHFSLACRLSLGLVNFSASIQKGGGRIHGEPLCKEELPCILLYLETHKDHDNTVVPKAERLSTSVRSLVFCVLRSPCSGNFAHPITEGISGTLGNSQVPAVLGCPTCRLPSGSGSTWQALTHADTHEQALTLLKAAHTGLKSICPSSHPSWAWGTQISKNRAQQRCMCHLESSRKQSWRVVCWTPFLDFLNCCDPLPLLKEKLLKGSLLFLTCTHQPLGSEGKQNKCYCLRKILHVYNLLTDDH